jgi:GNAT superfamily N-acetyltransferase
MPRTTDLAAVRAQLETDRAWSVYALGDLAPAFSGHATWHLTGGGLPGLLLLYQAFDPPVLFAHGSPAAVAGLLAELDGPPRFYLSIRPEVLPAIQARFVVSHLLPMWRMTFSGAGLPAAAAAGAVRLGPEHLAALVALYADGSETGESPDFFGPEMLAQGVFYGVWQGGVLAAAAGTHLVAPEIGVAAVGNVYTRRDWRGRGLAQAAAGAVVSALRAAHPALLIALNVSQGNPAAIAVYRRLGFEPYCAFYEGIAEKG